MIKPRGKTPSLISGSSGKPILVEAGRLRSCTRCKGDILKGVKCFEIPKIGGGFTPKKPYCSDCFSEILQETKSDLDQLGTLL
jgi:hypothetical protein